VSLVRAVKEVEAEWHWFEVFGWSGGTRSHVVVSVLCEGVGIEAVSGYLCVCWSSVYE